MRIEPTQSSTLRAQRKAYNKVNQGFAKLSSGKNLNHSADNPVALTIYKQLEAQELSISQASRNTGAGMDIARTMDGALSQQTIILSRMRELSLAAGNGTMNQDQRDMISQEFNSLRADLDRVANTTSQGGQPLLQGGSVELQVGTHSGGANQVTLSIPDGTTANLGVSATQVSTSADAWAAIDDIDTAIQTLNTQRANIGSTENRLMAAQSNLHQSRQSHSAAKSRIGDTDFAQESTDLGRQRFRLLAALKMQQIESNQKGSVLSLMA